MEDPLERKPTTVRREVVIERDPSRVFAAWADPNEISRWYVESADGDARKDDLVTWTLGGEPQRLRATVAEPHRHLIYTNVGDTDWRDTVLDIRFEPEGAPGSTRVVVEQTTPSPALREHMLNVDTGWACTLAVLQEYLENHEGKSRRRTEARAEGTLDYHVVAELVASPRAIAEWAPQPPERILATAPRGAAFTLTGFPGVFTVMTPGGVVVFYSTWSDDDLNEAQRIAADFAQQLLSRVSVPAAAVA